MTMSEVAGTTSLVDQFRFYLEVGRERMGLRGARPRLQGPEAWHILGHTAQMVLGEGGEGGGLGLAGWSS